MPPSLHSSRYAKFRKALIAERKRLSVTQMELAAKLGKHQSFVSKYENGDRRLDVIEFFQIAEAIGIEPLAFLRKFVSR